MNGECQDRALVEADEECTRVRRTKKQIKEEIEDLVISFNFVYSEHYLFLQLKEGLVGFCCIQPKSNMFLTFCFYI